MIEPPQTLLKKARLVLPDRVVKADLLIEGDRIMAIGDHISASDEMKVLKLKGQFLLPGFIDIHHHGALGFDYSLGIYEPASQTFSLQEDTYRQGVLRALGYFLHHGVTRVFPTSLAAPLSDLTMAFRQLRTLADDKDEPLSRMIGGINVEGTFLKLPAYAGAQSPEYFYPPSEENWQVLRDAAGSLIRIVNLPPEHGEPGLALIKNLSQQGIVLSAGHSGAEADAMFEAIGAGTRLGVHFFNGPSRSSSKAFHDGGAEEALLRADEVSLELIVDGYHVHPAYVRDAIARKGYDRIILITDSMFVNGMEKIKGFSLCGIPGAVSQNGEYLQVTDREDTLFGSVLTSDRGLENVLGWLTRDMTGIWHRNHPALELEEALVQASRMASGNPARLLGLDHGKLPTGKIEEGYAADLVQAEVTSSAGNYSFRPKRVWLCGREYEL